MEQQEIGGLGCSTTLVCPEQANSLYKWSKLRKHYSHLVAASVLSRQVVWASNGSLLAENADYYMFVNVWVWQDQESNWRNIWGSVLESGLYQK